MTEITLLGAIFKFAYSGQRFNFGTRTIYWDGLGIIAINPSYFNEHLILTTVNDVFSHNYAWQSPDGPFDITHLFVKGKNDILIEGICYDTVFNSQAIIIRGNISTIPIDPCEGVVCDNVCMDYDLYSQKCVDGECVPDQLLEENSQDCEYIVPDPCEGIPCLDYCDDINHIKYSNGYCINGECVYNTIEENSIECGYIPPEIEEPIDEEPEIESPIEEEPSDMSKIYGLLAGIGLGAILLFKK